MDFINMLPIIPTRRLKNLVVCVMMMLVHSVTNVHSSWFAKKKNRDEKTLVIPLKGRVDTTDITQINTLYEARVISGIGECLVAYNYTSDSYELVPSLLREMPTVSKNGLVYTFSIKRGIFFHNHVRFKGKKRELTAEDVAFSLTQHIDPKRKSIYYELYKHIEGAEAFHEGRAHSVAGIKVIDRYTLQVVCESVCPTFLACLAMPTACIIARESLGNGTKEDFCLIGTGPYTLERAKLSDSDSVVLIKKPNKVVLIKNPDYRDNFFPKVSSEKFSYMRPYEGKKMPFLDKICYKTSLPDDKQWFMFDLKQLDVIPILSSEQCKNVLNEKKGLKDIFKQKKMNIFSPKPLDIRYITFNFSHPVFKKYSFLHKVIALSYNIDYAVKNIMYGYANIAQGVIPPGVAGYQANLQNPCAYNPEQAQELLVKHGHKDGKGIPTLVYTVRQGNDADIKIAQILKDDLRKIGIRLEITPRPWNDIMKEIDKGEGGSVMMCTYGWGLDTPYAIDTLSLFYSHNVGSINPSHYTDPVYDTYFEQSKKVDPDSSAYMQLCKKMNEKLVKDTAAIFLWSTERYDIFYTYVKNYRSSAIMYGTEKYLDITSRSPKAKP